MFEPLVKGGIFKFVRYDGQGPAPAEFINTTDLLINDQTVIVSVTHPTMRKADPTLEGWFISDFYAFNYLFRHMTSSQTWLTAADPEKLLQALEAARQTRGTTSPTSDETSCYSDVYLHGNPFRDRKVVLSQELLANGELTPVTVVQSSEMTNRFLGAVRDASKKVAKNKGTLLLLIFCHGSDDNRLFLSNGDRQQGLSLIELQAAIDPWCRTTVISTACYSGRWAIRDPSQPHHEPMDITMLSASQRMSNSWPCSKSLGRASGSIFATTLMKSLQYDASSSLNSTDSNHATCLYNCSCKNDQLCNKVGPVQKKVTTFNSFCRSFIETCQKDVHRLCTKQEFTFNAHRGQYSHPSVWELGLINHPPPRDLAGRWESLQTVPYSGSETDKMHLDPHPDNPFFCGNSRPSHVAGAPDISFEEIDMSIKAGKLSVMAGLFLDTCPGDWTRGWGTMNAFVLKCARDGNDSDETFDQDPDEDFYILSDEQPDDVSEEESEKGVEEEISARYLIQYRWEICQLADAVVYSLGCPLPSGQRCIFWDEMTWSFHTRNFYDNNRPDYPFENIYMSVSDEFRRAHFPPTTKYVQGAEWFLPREYIAAAIIEKGQLLEDSLQTAKEAIDLLNHAASLPEVQGRPLNAPRVIQQQREWIQAPDRASG